MKQVSHVEESHSSFDGLGPSSAIAPHRRDFNRRDYTSITDELEVLLPGCAQGRDENEPSPPVAIKIEEHMLQDAEDDDYNAFENLIERRMRRDSCDMHSSMEDMVNKSIRNSSTSSSEDEALGGEGGSHQMRAAHLRRGQSRIRTRKTEVREDMRAAIITASISPRSPVGMRSRTRRMKAMFVQPPFDSQICSHL